MQGLKKRGRSHPLKAPAFIAHFLENIMKRITIISLFLALLCLGFPAMVQAQNVSEVFNDITDVLDIGNGRVIICTFDESAQVTVTTEVGVSSGTTVRLGNYLDGGVDAGKKVFVFARKFTSASMSSVPGTVRLGSFNTQKNVTGFTATQKQDFINHIDLTWNAVSGAEGYIIFRHDLQGSKAHAVLVGEQLTSWRDVDVWAASRYTYSIAAYNTRSRDQSWLSGLAQTSGETRPIGFGVTAMGESKVRFEWDYDNQFLLGLTDQAAHLEIYQLDAEGAEIPEPVFTKPLPFLQSTGNDLLFSKALKFSNDATAGVNLTTNLPTQTKWTTEMWIKPNVSASGRNQYLLANSQMQLYMMPGDANGTRLALSLWNNPLYTSATGSIKYGQWNHITISNDAQVIRVYLNGELLKLGEVGAANLDQFLIATTTYLFNSTPIGQLYMNGNGQGFEGEMGMLRIWGLARTDDQIKHDYRDRFDSAPPGLLGQWTFETESLTLPSSPNSANMLYIASSDIVNHKIRWTSSYELGSSNVTDHHTTWLPQPLTADQGISYKLKVFETGTGRLVDDDAQTANFVHPGAPGIDAITESVGETHQIKLNFTPKSVYADGYKVYRKLGNGERTYLGKVDVGNYTEGALSNKAQLHFTDKYQHGLNDQIMAGQEYTYEVEAHYSIKDFSDGINKASTTEPTSDYTFAAASADGKVALTWSNTNLTTDGYTSYNLERNGELLTNFKTSANQTSYSDTLALSGTTYEYSLVPLKNGVRAFQQKASAKSISGASVEGFLIASANDMALPGKQLKLERKREDNTYEPVRNGNNDLTATTTADGKFVFSDFDIGLDSEFRLVSASGEPLTNHEFRLKIDDKVKSGIFVKMTVAPWITNQVNSLLGNMAEDPDQTTGARLSWVFTPLEIPPAYPGVFANVYRGSELIDILYGAQVPQAYTDTKATNGNTTYKVKIYYHYTDGQGNAASDWDESSEEVAFPDLQAVTDLTVTANAVYEMEATWTYPKDKPVGEFRLYRRNAENELKFIKSISATSGIVSGDDKNYTITDTQGRPGDSYDYVLQALPLSGAAQVLAEQTSVTVAVIPNASFTSFTAANASTSADHTKWRVTVTKAINDSKAWDGFVVKELDGSSEVGHFMGLKKASVGTLPSDSENYSLFSPLSRTKASPGYRLSYYKHTDYGLYVSSGQTISTQLSGPASPSADPTAGNLSTGSLIIQKPTNFSASRDVKGQIFLSWDYPGYTDKVTFDLKRKLTSANNWTNLATLGNEQRAYIDADLTNQVYEYKLVAQRGAETSGEVWTWGKSRRQISLEGWVTDSNGVPLPYTYVKLGNVWRQADAAGYYRFEDLNLSDGTVDMKVATIDQQSVTDAQSIIISSSQQRYRKDVVIAHGRDVMPANSLAAVLGHAEHQSLENEVYWKSNSTKYVGFNVYKGVALVDNVANGQLSNNFFFDPVDDPAAATNHTYTVVPYQLNYAGEQIEDRYASLDVSQTYPEIAHPAYINAYPIVTDGTVKLTWSHRRGNVDGYIIERNGQELARQPHASLNQYVDDTGIPNQSYIYKVYSYLERNGQFIKSRLSAQTDTRYPSPADVTSVNLVSGINLDGNADNTVKISWVYPEGVDHQGAAIYRGTRRIAIVNDKTTAMVDSTGIPGTLEDYTVRTVILKEGVQYESQGVSESVLFPKIIQPEMTIGGTKVHDMNVNWNYAATGVDAFELVINVHGQGGNKVEVLRETIKRNGNEPNHSYHFHGHSGLTYDYKLAALSTRNNDVYRSDTDVENSRVFPQLPNPVVQKSGPGANDYVDFAWTYSEPALGSFEIEFGKVGNMITLQLEPNQNSFRYLPDRALRAQGGDFTFILRAYQKGRVGNPGTSTAHTWTWPLNADNHNTPATFTASDNNANAVELRWTAPNSGNPSHYVVYRDNVQLDQLAVSELRFDDQNSFPGVKHLYEVEAVYAGGQKYRRADFGKKLADGVVSVQALAGTGVFIPGIEFKISGLVNGYTYSAKATTDAEGNAAFKQVPYDQNGVRYTVTPVLNPEHYDVQSKQVTLDTSIPKNGVGAFTNKQQRSIRGLIANQYCTGGCALGDVKVSLYSHLEDKSVENPKSLVRSVHTDSNGEFSFAIPYVLSGFEKYSLEIENKSTDAQGQALNGVVYDYLIPQNGAKSSGLLTIDMPKAVLESKRHHELQVWDRHYFPLQVKVAGPGSIEVFDGYEFLVKVREVNGKFEEQYWTTNRVLDVNLPAYKYEVSVIDVNIKDLFSRTVVDYFRTTTKEVDNISSFTSYISGSPGSPPTATTTYLRYNERSNIRITSGLSQTGACSGIQFMHTDPSNPDAVPNQLTLNLAVEQVINNVTVPVTTGKIVANFSGGDVGDSWDNSKTPAKLTFSNGGILNVSGNWESLIVKATTPNLVAPHSQLLELYYYDAQDNFMGMTTKEIIVLGKQATPGRDVFIVPDNLDQAAVMVPLFVLRDPPGDKSYAHIKEKSSFSYTFLDEYDRSAQLGGVAKWETNIGFGYSQGETYAQGSDYEKTKDADGFTLNFSQGLSTASSSKVSTNLEGYLDGPDADIMVGTNVIMSYGVVQNLKWNFAQCAQGANLQKEISVLPNPTETDWIYTRSQVKNTINYYGTLVEKVGDNYRARSGVNLEVDNTNSKKFKDSEVTKERLANGIGNAKEMFSNLLKTVDSQFTPACEMCEFAAKSNEQLKKLLNITEGNAANAVRLMANDIRTFCNANVTEEDKTTKKKVCKPMGQLVDAWTKEVRAKYSSMYRKYLVISDLVETLVTASEGGKNKLDKKTLEEFLKDPNGVIKKKMEANLAKASLFDPLENLTFGAGSKVTRETTRKFSSSSQSSNGTGINLGTKTVIGVKFTFDAGGWFGLGAGAQTTLLKSEFKGGIGPYVTLKTKRLIGSKTTTGNEFASGFTLNDDDDGDHFSTDVYHSMTDGPTKSSSYFNIVGGRSSCPYEEGTVPRDMPRIRFLDDLTNANNGPTKFYDVDPNQTLLIPIGVTSGNLFGESRLIELAGVSGSNKKGLDMTSETVRINNYKGNVMWIKPNEEYRTYIRIKRQDLPDYDYTDLAVYVKPTCGRAKNNYWEGQALMDTVRFEVHYRKPISPIRLETDMGNWFIKKDTDTSDPTYMESQTFFLRNFQPDNASHSLKEIYLEYKRVNDLGWTRMTDAAGRKGDFASQSPNTLKQDYLLHYYRDNLHVYSEPTYPFMWNAPDMSLLPDGDYQVRATVVHENGSYAFSNILTGRVDRTPPQRLGYGQPADGLLSLGETVAISFDENIRCVDFLANGTITLTLIGGSPLVKGTDYTVNCSGSGITIAISDDALRIHDGKQVDVLLRGVEDLVGNQSDPVDQTWSFKIDFFKQTPSNINLAGPDDWLMNLVEQTATSGVLSFQISGYDVYQKSTSLTMVELQYKEANATEWTNIQSFTRSELALAYENLNDNSLVPRHSINWNTTGLADGSYAVRAVLTGNTGLQTITGSITGLTDRTAPEQLVAEPADGRYDRNDQVSFVFNEAIDCNRQLTISANVVPLNGVDADQVTPITSQCTGDQVVLTFDADVLEPYFGGEMTVTVGGIRDLAGNQVDGQVSHTFKIGQLGLPTSPVEILTPTTDWLVNLQNPETNITLSGYDLLGIDHSLVNIRLEYSKPSEGQWTTITTLTRGELVAEYQRMKTENNYTGEPYYTYTWTPGVLDATCEVRAVVTGAEGHPFYSGAVVGTIDKSRPYFTGETVPGTGVTIKTGTVMNLTFTEELARESFKAAHFKLTQSVTVGQVTERVEINRDFYLQHVDGNNIVIYFDDQFTSNFHGETIRVEMKDLTDLSGNAMQAPVSIDFQVENVPDPNSPVNINLKNIQLQGRQIPSGAVAVSWVNPGNESTNAYEVQRSFDAKIFEPVGRLTETGQPDYRMLDYIDFDEVVYYRVAQLTRAGETIESKVIGVESITSAGEEVVMADITPNPVEDVLVLRLFTSDSNRDFKVAISDMQGMIHLEENVNRDPSNRYSFKLPALLKPGIYILKVIVDGQYKTLKFLKQ